MYGESKMKQPTRIAEAGPPPMTFDKYAHNFKQEYFNSKFNLNELKAPVVAKKQSKVDVTEIDDRFNKYFDNLNQAQQPQPFQDDPMLADEEAMPKTSALDGLDLELSQSTQHFEKMLINGGRRALAIQKMQQRGAIKVEEPEPIIKNNELLESLNLNVGMDAMLKLQDKWAGKKKVIIKQEPRPINEIYSRE